jgi:hypothetical protein
LALLPSRGTAIPNDIITIRKLHAGELHEKVFAFNSIVKDTHAMPFYPPSYRTGSVLSRDIQCKFNSDGVPQAVVVDIPVQAWALDFSKAERARHRQFSDDDFSSGKVGVGHCALRDLFGDVYHQPTWLFRVPHDLTIQKGDVVEIQFGEVESGGGIGVVSTMIRTLGKRNDFPSDGHSAIFCK